MRNRKSKKNGFLSVLPAICLAALMACWSGGCAGGGTSGTGGVTFSGTLSADPTLRAAMLVPVAGVKVSILGQPGFDVTDPQGQFLLVTPARITSAELLFEGAELQSSYFVSNIPAAATQVKLELEVDADDAVREQSKKFEDDEGNEVDENEQESADDSADSGDDAADSDDDSRDDSFSDDGSDDGVSDGNDSSDDDGDGQSVDPTPGSDEDDSGSSGGSSGDGEDVEDGSPGDSDSSPDDD